MVETDFDECVQVGMVREEVFVVEERHMARHVGSGSSRVLATPWMIIYMERTAHWLLGDCLPAGYTSVGVLVDVRHLAPTPIGAIVRVRAEVTAVDGVRVLFDVQAWDEVEQIGAGRHERAMIDEARFLRRVEKKAQALSGG